MAEFTASTWQQGYWENVYSTIAGNTITSLWDSTNSLTLNSYSTFTDNLFIGSLLGGGTYTLTGSNLTSANIYDVAVTRLTVDQGDTLYLDFQGAIDLDGFGRYDYVRYETPTSYAEIDGSFYLSYSGSMHSVNITRETYSSSGVTAVHTGNGRGYYTQFSWTDGQNSFTATGVWNATEVNNSWNIFETLYSGDDSFSGSMGDDYLFGLQGDDFIDGSLGSDTAAYIYDSTKYEITKYADHVGVRSLANYFDEGTDILKDIEYLEFEGVIQSIPTTEFDALGYIASHPDLISAFANDAYAGFTHYVNYGSVEGREISFNANQYLDNYQDIRESTDGDIQAATNHFILYGYNEGRTDRPLEPASPEPTLENTYSGGNDSGNTISGTDKIDTVLYSNHDYSDVVITGFGDASAGANEVETGWNIKFSSTTSVENTSTTGTDILTSIERLSFTDSSVALDLQIEDNAGAALALLYAAFDDVPDNNTFGQWIAESDSLSLSGNGKHIDDLAQTMLDYYAPGGVSNTALIDLLYTNIVGNPPPDEKRQHYVDLIESGIYSQASFFAMAASTELNTTQYIDLVGTGLQYTPDETTLG